VKFLSLLAGMSLFCGLSVCLHVLASRAAKAAAWSFTPLSSSEPEAFQYERSVYPTALPAMQRVVVLVLAAGALAGWGTLAGPPWLVVLAVPVFAAALWFDLMHWERVSVSAGNLWFQRGLRGRIHQVAIENIRDLSVEEEDKRSLTLRHGLNNRLCRLSVCMSDKRVLPLPKTDANGGLEAVEAVANHLRGRLQMQHDRARIEASQRQADAAALKIADEPPDPDREIRMELRRLRRKALAPDVPKAVQFDKGD
jgi:hypothetical protein